MKTASEQEQVMQALLLGRAGMDLTTDASRRVWWLLNAPQAVDDVWLQMKQSEKANPDLYKMEYVAASRVEVK